MRIIDADELVKVFAENFIYFDIHALELVKTIDAVPVVRCKDCKFRFTRLCPTYGIEYDMENEPNVMWGIENPYGFCSYGKSIK